jgi:hypothetical protein
MKENLVEKFDDVKVSKTLPDTNQQDDWLPF